MIDQELETLKTLAINFREAIIRCDPRSLSIGMQTFPIGACGPSSELLRHYLIK
jgi:hypothetical protein